MNPKTRLVTAVLFVASTGFFTGTALAETHPAVVEFYPLLGKWHGQGQLSEPGQTPIKLKINVQCQKVSSGWAVQCAMQAKNKQMLMTESDLMGVDPVSGQAHWYAVTNQGETHDHLASWPDPHTMKAHYAWTQDGKHMQEDIVFELKGKHDMTFRSVVSADGKPAGEFSAMLKR